MLPLDVLPMSPNTRYPCPRAVHYLPVQAASFASQFRQVTQSTPLDFFCHQRQLLALS